MSAENIPPIEHIIIVTVGISIIDKTSGSNTYDAIERQLARSDHDIAAVEQGNSWNKQLDIEKDLFNTIPNTKIEDAIRSGKRNPYSAELSSLYLILKHKRIEAKSCRIVLVATDSAEGVFAARLNKRAIADRIFHCDHNKVLNWSNEKDNNLDWKFERLAIVRVSGLQVKDAAIFESEGNSEFVKLLERENQNARGGEKLLNITGGFKGIIPVAIGVAWRYGWSASYLYEETDQLIYYDRPPWLSIIPDKGPVTPVKLFKLGSLG
jgi:CRISPR/Cas system-associated protein Csm6